jgi:hypothetical protein
MLHSKASILLVAAVLLAGLLGPAQADRLTPPLALPGGGRVVKKQEVQKLTPTCSAQRTWVEVEGTAAADAAKRINQQIRRKITVGRKLKEADCAGSEEEEDYSYVNAVSVSGLWHRFLGTTTLVCFPGGSGRCSETCEVYDLQTGKRDNLKKYINPAGRAQLEQQVNQQAEADGFPGGYLPLELKESTMCLASDGITIRNLNDSGRFGTEFKVTLSQIATYFRLPADMASDVPKSR